MKVEQDLRIAIKAASAASKNQDRSKSERVLIEEWLKKYPAKAARARALVKAILAADAAERKAIHGHGKMTGKAESKGHDPEHCTMEAKKLYNKSDKEDKGSDK